MFRLIVRDVKSERKSEGQRRELKRGIMALFIMVLARTVRQRKEGRTSMMNDIDVMRCTALHCDHSSVP